MSLHLFFGPQLWVSWSFHPIVPELSRLHILLIPGGFAHHLPSWLVGEPMDSLSSWFQLRDPELSRQGLPISRPTRCYIPGLLHTSACQQAFHTIPSWVHYVICILLRFTKVDRLLSSFRTVTHRTFPWSSPKIKTTNFNHFQASQV